MHGLESAVGKLFFGKKVGDEGMEQKAEEPDTAENVIVVRPKDGEDLAIPDIDS